ncbi:MAG: transposase, partial [Acetobacteraceae bacterium]|nr:transposase [Acetobacteraceae bacterium]
MILGSPPGIGRINLAVLLSEASAALSSRDHPALRALCGAAPVTKHSGKSHIVVMRQAPHVRPCATQSITGHVLRPSTIPKAVAATSPYA